MGAGLAKESLIIILRNLDVYEVPAKNLIKNNKLKIDVKPIPLSIKYPELFNDMYFKMIKKYLGDVFIMKNCICFFTVDKSLSFRGIIFGLDSRQVRLQYSLFGLVEIFLSAQDSGSYMLTRPMYKYSHYAMAPFYWRNDRIYIITADEKLLCPTIDNQMYFLSVRTDFNLSLCARWPILTGFIADSVIYIIGVRNVYIFSENATQRNGTYKEVPNRMFYSCNFKEPFGKF